MTQEELIEAIKKINPSPSLDPIQKLKEELEKKNQTIAQLRDLMSRTPCTEKEDCIHCVAHQLQ